ncbi:major capsid protein [Mycobacteroides abscessus]|uniref:major capsid protein n=1 Tax=Mycobacteroides abscessus TaxID=36809 RepID=UPI00092BF4C7|nr:major capsid protein [Mycobacteroides abscessus]SHU33718.1 Uncharacterised protein [Mycobacteroides abscessus subsp. bolletii]SHW18416.1 Uncharacterised protein [Mycobacteroides abscessus subsp. bolletii]SHW24010.1 Uncharacterised protein [Mycobacteroides abscessus subsp. bolletii]SHW72952.1 Uncharacterised protein [Mycobacteroides abscessus subsp. bolletii]SKV51129.1 Uncharacterised protein [Mycobacteroides abscessus subsp. bolletii]
MTNLLSPTPSLSGRDLTVDMALKQPTRIRARIANLAASNLLIDKFFRGLGSPVQGGGMLYSVLKATDFFTTDVRQRGAGDEYEIVRGVDPETRLAKPEDWGGKFKVTDEQRGRNEISYLDQNTTQLANTIARKLDTRAMEVVQAAVTGDNVVPGHDWGNLTFVGPEANLTPSALRPTADFSAAQLASSLQELGITHDLLVLHPAQAHDLRVAYGDQLGAMLASAGLTMFENPRITAGEGWVLQRGQVGIVGFEHPLTVNVWDDRSVRSTWVQAYCVPALAVEKPYAAKKLTGLAL